MRQGVRLVVIVILVAATVGLVIHHGAAYEDGWPYPTGEQLAEDIGTHDGEQVLVFGTVETIEDGAFVIEVEDDPRHLVTVEADPPDVDVGGVVQVYGTVEDGHSTMSADEIVVVNDRPRDQWYKLILSVGGVVLAAGMFLWYWSVDWRSLHFVPRHG